MPDRYGALPQPAINAPAQTHMSILGRTVIAGGDYELLEPQGVYEPLEGEEFEGFPLVWLDTPPDWLFRTATDGWEALVSHRAAAAATV